MSISLVQKPNVLSWSKNYQQFVFQYSLMTPGNKMQMEFVDHNNSYAVLAQVEYPFTQTSGLIIVKDVQEITDTFASYFMPTKLASGVSETIEETSAQNRAYDIRWRIWDRATGGVTSWTYANYFPIVAKGGIGNLKPLEEYRINFDSIVSTFDPVRFFPGTRRFCTYVPSGRMMRPDEWGWLLYLTELGATGSGPTQSISYDVHYLDGTSSVITRAIPVGGNPDYYGRSWYVPIGVSQAKLDPTNKGVYYYDVVVHKNAPFIEIQTYRVWVDNRPYNDTITLFYRNSMGGIDNIHLRGKLDVMGGSITKKEYAQHRAFPSSNQDGESPYFEGNMRFTFKGNTGFISRDHKFAMAELFNTTGAWLMKDEMWLPVRVPAQDMEPVSSADGLHSYSIEFESASIYKTLPVQLTSLL